MDMEEPPHLFLCPISMELMEDPVTVSTGVTYDRRSIEQWLFSYGRTTCPATMQPLANLDLTPNHTLMRVISTWARPRLPLVVVFVVAVHIVAVESGP